LGIRKTDEVDLTWNLRRIRNEEIRNQEIWNPEFVGAEESGG